MNRTIGNLKDFSRSFATPPKRPRADAEVYPPRTVPYSLEAPHAMQQQPSTGDSESYGFGDITGCVTPYSNEPLFFDESEGGEDSISSDYQLSHCKDEFWDLNLLND